MAWVACGSSGVAGYSGGMHGVRELRRIARRFASCARHLCSLLLLVPPHLPLEGPKPAPLEANVAKVGGGERAHDQRAQTLLLRRRAVLKVP